MRFAIAALAGVCGACSRTVDIQVIPYPWVARPPAAAPSCKAPVYRIGDPVPASCSDIGDVFVGDTGTTTDCDLDRMLDEVQAQTCAYGADAAQVFRVEEPSLFASSCYEVRAKFLRCPPAS